ncbi:Bax inhibitor-1/YccA family protein [Mechercharimyces sp. CAU 1602]|uniref:Bax inhibitor-1/YccA family protein n=1 Tax=Mechercharimyces sp. CAU 1602 TaxID=2973933 RepID=UPI0021631A98|nr:Bax inhibitor-1/YccA family protein [Mechercharimyces sp. CAU 1602]MCS1350046.1 Bax inhibitor-1/YccA family protein [Mechercharimyces sp. CAU 1602]
MDNQHYVGSEHVASSGLMTRVFAWMFAGLALTAIISFFVLADGGMITYFEQNMMVFYGLLIGELILVFFLAARVHKMSVATASFFFFFYAALNGFTLSPLLSIYNVGSIGVVFAITAGMFGSMALYGYVTKRDLSKLGSILFMALIGLIIASIANIFMNSGVLYWVISYVGVLIFCGLTAFDVQKIKRMEAISMDEDNHAKAAIMGALALYLDFINMFIFLLRIFGNRD